uniref:Uncharacterized protein n=1 Tax=Rhizophora mucronata TaxID=61149 RepID=A0A2P2N7B3_RHIMU
MTARNERPKGNNVELHHYTAQYQLCARYG